MLVLDPSRPENPPLGLRVGHREQKLGEMRDKDKKKDKCCRGEREREIERSGERSRDRDQVFSSEVFFPIVS